MSVADNVAYGGGRKSAELLARFGIESLARLKPGELSGGERQRVALARALARDPASSFSTSRSPRSTLTHARRVRGELRGLLKGLDLPTLVVTHSFEDAAALTDRIGVLVEGRLVQMGSRGRSRRRADDAFRRRLHRREPAHRVVRGPRATGSPRCSCGRDRIVSTDQLTGEVGAVVHPWEIGIARAMPLDSMQNHVRGAIESLVPGRRTACAFASARSRPRSRRSPPRASALQPGDEVVASFKASGTRLIPLG